MSFCEHCAGQRFDRAQVLRALRDARKRLRVEGSECSSDEVLALSNIIELRRSLLSALFNAIPPLVNVPPPESLRVFAPIGSPPT